MNKLILFLFSLIGASYNKMGNNYDAKNKISNFYGNWQSVDDEESKLIITEDSLLFLNNENRDSVYFDSYLWLNRDTFYTIAQDDTSYYSIEYLDNNNLTLRYLGFDRNNYYTNIQLLNYQKL